MICRWINRFIQRVKRIRNTCISAFLWLEKNRWVPLLQKDTFGLPWNANTVDHRQIVIDGIAVRRAPLHWALTVRLFLECLVLLLVYSVRNVKCLRSLYRPLKTWFVLRNGVKSICCIISVSKLTKFYWPQCIPQWPLPNWNTQICLGVHSVSL